MMLQRGLDGYLTRTQALFSFSAAAFLLTASSAFGQAPSVVADAQQTIGSNFYSPQSVAVAPNGTVYVADLNNTQVVQLVTNLPGASTQTTVTTGDLFGPMAVAVDASGDLYIADYLNFFGVFGYLRVIEVLAQNGALSNNINTIYAGFEGENPPTSLAVDAQNHVYMGLSGGGAGIYTVANGNLTELNITGLPNGFTPKAMVRNSATSLYFVNSAAANGGVYVAPDTGGSAQPVATGYFNPENPTGVALDSSGDLFVLSQILVNGTTSPQVIEIPAGSPTTPYIIPSTGLVATTGMALDPSGNLDVVEAENGGRGAGLVTQLDYLNTINMGSAPVYSAGTVIPFNFEFNAATTLSGFQAVTLGDLGSTNDVVSAGSGSCVNQILGNTISASEPYICEKPFEAVPQYTGTRASAIQVKGPTTSGILASSPVYESGASGAQITYPLDETVTATPLLQPQGVAISGFNQKVYIADFGSAHVYSTSGLTGSTPTAVPTGTITLQAPSAVALNGEGDLYVADFGAATVGAVGKVIVVPTTTGKAASVVNTGTLLQHPISLAVDYLGNLYIGDAGVEGDTATSSSPGYVVKVTRSGTATKLTIPSAKVIIFPQALATDGSNGNLYIGDGGDNSADGQVVKVPANGNAVSQVSFPNETPPTNPTGLSLDAAENLYVLDGNTSTITVVPVNGNNSYLVAFVNTSLAAPSALASSAGGQSFVIANIGNGSANSLVFLNGNSSTLAFGSVKDNTTPSKTATIYNIGNESLTLGKPAETGAGFTISSGTSCYNGLTLSISNTCGINVEFSPTAVQSYSGTITVPSTAYNGTNPPPPVLNLSGTGSLTGSIDLSEALRPRNDGGRKSFRR